MLQVLLWKSFNVRPWLSNLIPLGFCFHIYKMDIQIDELWNLPSAQKLYWYVGAEEVDFKSKPQENPCSLAKTLWSPTAQGHPCPWLQTCSSQSHFSDVHAAVRRPSCSGKGNLGSGYFGAEGAKGAKLRWKSVIFTRSDHIQTKLIVILSP